MTHVDQMEETKLTDINDGYERLFFTILAQATHEYIREYCVNKKSTAKLNELKEFFNGSLFAAGMPSVTGAAFMAGLNNLCEKNKLSERKTWSDLREQMKATSDISAEELDSDTWEFLDSVEGPTDEDLESIENE